MRMRTCKYVTASDENKVLKAVGMVISYPHAGAAASVLHLHVSGVHMVSHQK